MGLSEAPEPAPPTAPASQHEPPMHGSGPGTQEAAGQLRRWHGATPQRHGYRQLTEVGMLVALGVGTLAYRGIRLVLGRIFSGKK